jgi:bacillithiol system protein YtxJ
MLSGSLSNEVMNVHKLETIEQFQSIQKEKQPFLLIKHSLTCPISQKAWGEFERFAKDHPDIETYYLYVQEARPLSNYIAETFQIKHESPQVLFIADDRVQWHASHWNITYDQMKKAAVNES